MKQFIYFTVLILAFFSSLLSFSQQVADSAYDVSVARPAFTRKHPKVLFDEGHDNFHTSGGRYYPFARLICNDGVVVSPNKEKFTEKVLEGYDLLVIANASNKFDTTAFTREECGIVRKWIEGGGSLLLITDHMPVSKLNMFLAEALGVQFTLGTVVDSVNQDPTIKEASHLMFNRHNGLLINNAITKDVNHVLSFTGQGVKGPAGSIPILQFSSSAYYDLIELADVKFTDQGIKAKIKRTGIASANGFSQAVAFKLGKGRVIVTGEAAMLTAQTSGAEKFGMNYPGVDNKQLVLNMVRWLLNR